MSRLPAALVVACVVILGAPLAAEAEPVGVSYVPPADAPVVDVFRPPSSDYGAGNRGIDYGTERGDAVRASADGVVVFSGAVGGSMHVVVRHADGIRTSYSFLDRSTVRRGQRVRAGEELGVAHGPFHFGARAGNAYLDPMHLLRGVPGRVHLVPDSEPLSEAAERSLVAKLVGRLRAGGAGALSASGAAVAWARDGALARARGVAVSFDELRGWIHYAQALGLPLPDALRLIVTTVAWHTTPCTAAAVTTPRLRERRIVVLVAGLGSSSPRPCPNRVGRCGGGSVVNVDTAALGYDPKRYQFSYRGGSTDDTPYEPADTFGDLAVSGGRLRDLIRRVEREHPGVPIDLIAHSQGGLVARSALADLADERGSNPVTTLITLATPHGGSDAATAISMINSTATGEAVTDAVDDRFGVSAESADELSEVSDFVDDLGRRPLPPDVDVISIAARSDLMVPSPRSHLAGARNVVVTAPGSAGDQHSALPGSAAAHREMALALAGLPPACESLQTALADVAAGEMVSYIEDAIGALATVAGHAADHLVPPAALPPDRRSERRSP